MPETKTPTEATITINGKLLTKAQSLSVRVAVSSFIHDLHYVGLGTDQHGVNMTDEYLSRCREIEPLIKGRCRPRATAKKM